MPAVKSMKLTADERSWLDAYQRRLAEQFPGLVLNFLVFGSKARGDDRPNSDLDVLVVIREGDWRLKDAVARPSYDLAIGTDTVPSIQIYTEKEWQQLRQRQSVFRDAVLRDGVAIQ